MWPDFRGGARSRAGTAFVGMSKQNPILGGGPAIKPRLIPFRFSITQNYALEFGHQYVRFIFQGGYVTEASFGITAITRANPCQITAPGHNFVNGDWVFLAGINGMTQLNGNTYIVAGVAGGAFTLQNTDGVAINSSAYTAYSSAGTAARIYTVVTPYAANDLPLLKFTQSADVLSIAHQSYPPYDLSRLGATNWTMTQTTFTSVVAPPASAGAAATVAANPAGSPPTLPTAYAYVVTAVDYITGQESIASPIANTTNSVDIASTAGAVSITWPDVAGAGFYNIYKAPPSYNTNLTGTNALPVPIGAPFGYIGTSFGNNFVDTNISPTTTIAPPLHLNPFAPGAVQFIPVTASSTDWALGTTMTMTTGTGTGFIGAPVMTGGTSGSSNWTISGVYILNHGQNYTPGDAPHFTGVGSSVTATATIGPTTGTYPGTVAYFQQRRVYASTLNQPDTVFFSKSGAFANFDAANPIGPNDAITATPWSEQVDGIQWMVSMPLGLVTFTGNGVWQVGASGSFASSPAAITPTNLIAAPQSSVGANAQVAPVRVNWDILYLQAKGNAVRDLTYTLYLNIYTGLDISWPSSHLLIGHQIQEWAWCEEPYRILWMAREDGILTSLTYLKEQEVKGWARHDTFGQVRSLCSASEPPVDALYMVVQRPVPAGGTRYFVERMDNRIWFSTEDPWCVDCGAAYLPTNPNAGLSASDASATGANSVTFTASANIFSGATVGQVIRLGGGIAAVDADVDASHVTGHWVFPCTQVLPGSNIPFTQAAGAWSLGSPQTVIAGLYYLAGQTVVGLADGVPVGPLVVSATGTVTLPFNASYVKLGFPFAAQLQSVYLDTGQPTIQARRKTIPRVAVRVEASCQIQAGTNQVDSSSQSPPALYSNWTLGPVPGTGMTPVPDQSTPYTSVNGQTVTPLFTGDLIVPVISSWNRRGQVAVQQVNPLPLSVLALVPEVLPGDTPENEIRPTQRPQQGQQGQRRAA